MKKILLAAAAAIFLLAPSTSHAQIKVGVLVSMTGPAASLGIAEKNAVALMDTEIGGKSVEYVILDDASDTTGRQKIGRKTIERRQSRYYSWWNNDSRFPCGG